jgi:hypothetical protein
MSFSEFNSKVRAKLFQSTNYYVRKTGNDNNNGRTAATAFLTLEKAIDKTHYLDATGYIVTVDLGPGSWVPPAGGYDLARLDVPVRIQGAGDTTLIENSNVGFSVHHCSQPVVIQDLKFQNCGVSIGVYEDSHVNLGGTIRFAGGNICINCVYDSTVRIVQDAFLEFSGTLSSAFAIYHGFIWVYDATLYYNNPSFSYGNAHVWGSGVFNIDTTATVSGSATGKRFSVETNGGINTGGAGVNRLPGSIAGIATNGGQYI